MKPSNGHEAALQRSVTVWIAAGLLFMLLPKTFLGAWNLIAISDQRAAAHLDPAWIQAHGHAQVFGWIGTFILGIGSYSLSKMRGLARFAVTRSWTSWALWTLGVGLRWATVGNCGQPTCGSGNGAGCCPSPRCWNWPGSSSSFITVGGHRGGHQPGETAARGSRVWIGIVVGGTLGFLLSLLANFVTALQSGLRGATPALMFAGLGLLNLGCLPRVTSEIGAYEGYLPVSWPVLPVSASRLDKEWSYCFVRFDDNGKEQSFLYSLLNADGGAAKPADIKSGTYERVTGGRYTAMTMRITGPNTYSGPGGAGKYRLEPTGRIIFETGPFGKFSSKLLSEGRIGLNMDGGSSSRQAVS